MRAMRERVMQNMEWKIPEKTKLEKKEAEEKEEGGSAVKTEILLLGRLPTSLQAVQGATKNLDTR